MSNLLVFFAIPLATIIIAVVLERVWKNYILVTLFAFAVFLIVAFAVGDTTLLVLVIIYTILAFLAAFLSMLFRKICKRLRNLDEIASENEENTNDDRHNCKCRNNNCSDDSNNCRISDNTQDLAINARVMPNSSNNGRTGTFRGRYRRRF